MRSADPMQRVITCDLALTVVEPAELVLQVVAATSAGQLVDERLDIGLDGSPSSPTRSLTGRHGTRLHLVEARPGRLTVSYRAELLAPPTDGPEGDADDDGSAEYERQTYRRPSRYCPSDHLVGFAVAEFGVGADPGARVAAITDWIRRRIGYVPGSSGVHDSAEDTLLTGMGTCRDFAHLGAALCRATGIPARFAAVYAPGLSPMDFHAVFEAFAGGRWSAHDATGLAPRPAMVRIATGRDAADTAFAAVTSGIAQLESIEVSATVGASLPADDHTGAIPLP